VLVTVCQVVDQAFSLGLHFRLRLRGRTFDPLNVHRWAGRRVLNQDGTLGRIIGVMSGYIVSRVLQVSIASDH
jgi:hypothetical protein